MRPHDEYPAGSSCYLGLNILAPAPGQTSASVAVLSNAVNAPAGVNIAVSANVVPDLRPGTSVAIAITPPSGVVYPGATQIKVTVSSSAGTPTGSVILSVPGSGTSQSSQTQPLVSGVATFNFTGLPGGTYSVNALYGGSGTEGATQNACSPANSVCFAEAQVRPHSRLIQRPRSLRLGRPEPKVA